MPTTVLYTILAILILTTIYVLVRTIIFQRSTGAVGKIDGKRIPVEEMAKMVKCYAQLIQVNQGNGIERIADFLRRSL